MNPETPASDSAALPVPPPEVIPTAPPTIPGELIPVVTRPVWPGLLGGISIPLAVIGGVISLISFTAHGDSPHFSNNSSVWGREANARWETGLLICDGLGILLAVLLLAAAIVLIFRARVAVASLRIWAWVKVALEVPLFAIYLAWAVWPAAVDRDTDEAAMSGCLAALGCLFGIAWPIFMLLWLRRRSIRTEVANWR